MKVLRYMTGPIQANTYLAYDEESKKGFIVDPGGYDGRLTAAAREAGVDVLYIILTHGHADHIGGVAEFRKDFPAAQVVADAAEEELLSDAAKNASLEMFGVPVTVKADLEVTDGQELAVGGLKLTFIHTPGHTKGGMCIYTEKTIFSGDTLFRFSIGRTDFYGGDFGEITASIKNKLFVFPDDTRVLPGHMEETTIGAEKKGNPFV